MASQTPKLEVIRNTEPLLVSSAVVNRLSATEFQFGKVNFNALPRSAITVHSPTADRGNDKIDNESHTNPMSDQISRPELDAKLDATNARIDARLASFESTIREAMSENKHTYTEMRGELKAIHVDLSYLKNIKSSIWGAAGATVLGVGGLVAAMLSFGIASYDTARENTNLAAESKAQIVQSSQKVDLAILAMTTQLAETRRQSEETARLLEQISAQHRPAPAKAKK